MKTMNFGYQTSFQLIDKGLIEAFGPTGIVSNLQPFSRFFASQQTGIVSVYALTMVFAIIVGL